jgi:hypothetical protein
VRLIGALAFLATPALAQDAASRIPVGAHVELTPLGLIESRLEGRMQALDTSGIRLTVTRLGSTAYMPWPNVESLHWSRGRSRARGALDGALVGLFLGGSLYLNSQPWNAQTDEQKKNSRRIAVTAAGFLAATTAIGAAVGSHRWRGVPIPRGAAGNVALTFHPDDDIRIETTSGRFLGQNAVASDSLRFTTTSGPMALAWRNVGDVQVRGGKRRVPGVLFGLGGAVAALVIGESFADFSNAELIAYAAAGGVLGYRYLSPEGWISLPQPRR